MRFAGIWTGMMAISIAVFGAALVGFGLGGGIWAWLISLPGLIVGLHVLGLPIVILSGLAERGGVMRATWRPMFHECLMIGSLLSIGWAIFFWQVMICVIFFFSVMYGLRLLFRRCWIPGEPEDLGG